MQHLVLTYVSPFDDVKQSVQSAIFVAQNIILGGIISVNSLRQWLHEQSKNKDLIIYCQVGLRGNLAYR